MKKRNFLILSLVVAFMLACGTLPPATVSPAEAPLDDKTGGGETTDEPTTEPVGDPLFEQAGQFAGTWEGDWNNTTYGSSGGLTAVISVQQGGTAGFELTVTGNMFGSTAPPTTMYDGTYDAEGLHFEGADLPIFGTLEILIDTTGNVSMHASLLPSASIAEVFAEGTVTGDEMMLSYRVTFIGGGEAEGTAGMTRNP